MVPPSGLRLAASPLRHLLVKIICRLCIADSHLTESALRNPPCGFLLADSALWIPLCGFRFAKSALGIPVWVFRFLNAILRIPLCACRFAHAAFRILLGRFRFVVGALRVSYPPCGFRFCAIGSAASSLRLPLLRRAPCGCLFADITLRISLCRFPSPETTLRIPCYGLRFVDSVQRNPLCGFRSMDSALPSLLYVCSLTASTLHICASSSVALPLVYDQTGTETTKKKKNKDLVDF